VATQVDVSTPPAFTLDMQDQPHIVFISQGKLMHATLSGGAWQQDVITTDFYDTPNAQIATDAGGNPFVVYRRGNSGEYIQFARLNGGAWQVAQLSSYSNSFRFALTIDGQNRPCVARVNNSNGKPPPLAV
jgi:hypothetical protein